MQNPTKHGAGHTRQLVCNFSTLILNKVAKPPFYCEGRNYLYHISLYTILHCRNVTRIVVSPALPPNISTVVSSPAQRLYTRHFYIIFIRLLALPPNRPAFYVLYTVTGKSFSFTMRIRPCSVLSLDR